MMTSLFSIFDTKINNSLELNWLSTLIIFLLLPSIHWMIKSRLIKMFTLIILTIYNEFKIILTKKFNYLNSLFFTALFIFILSNNFMGLFPYIFTSSSHLIFSLTFSLPMWMGLMIFGWMKNSNFMFSHLIPQGTPVMLMSFMVLIETVSNLIRPMTLPIRLTANMIAGHLLLTLLSNTAISNFPINIVIITVQIMLLMLEFSVSIIQAYVFSILSTLYTKETNYE